MAAGARPVNVDAGPDDHVDADLLEEAITSPTEAILPVHLSGNPAYLASIMLVGRQPAGLLEDAAQSVDNPLKASVWVKLGRWDVSVPP